MTTEPLFKVGDRVRRTHPWDGTLRAGLPVGPLLTIIKVFPSEPVAIYQLLDGKTEFEFNLLKEDVISLHQKWAS
jgi:hypothetical protein